MGIVPNHVQKNQSSDIFAKRSTMINDVKISEAYSEAIKSKSPTERYKRGVGKNTRSGLVDDSHISWFHYFFDIEQVGGEVSIFMSLWQLMPFIKIFVIPAGNHLLKKP